MLCPNPPVPEQESGFAARGAQAAAALVTSVKANLPQGQAALRKASAVRGVQGAGPGRGGGKRAEGVEAGGAGWGDGGGVRGRAL